MTEITDLEPYVAPRIDHRESIDLPLVAVVSANPT